MSTRTHLDDRLSAYLDGELDEDEQQTAYRHLVVCALCQTQLESVNRVRIALRGAPPVEPPTGFVELVIRQRRRRRFAPVVAAVTAVAAAWLVAVGAVAGSARAKVDAPVQRVAAALAEDDLTGFTEVGADELPSPFVASESLGDTELVGVFQSETSPGWLLLYQGAHRQLAVYEQLGELRSTGRIPAGDFEALAVQRGELAVTVVGTPPSVTGLDVERELPRAAGPSLSERARRAARYLVDGFGLDVG